MIKVLIADDLELIRSAFHSLLMDVPGILVVGTAEDGQGVVDFCQRHQVDVVLLDLQMPVMNGLEAMQILSRQRRPPKLIAVSVHVGAHWVQRAVRLKASGYLIKTERAENLVEAIRTVHQGGHWYSRAILPVLAQLARDPEVADRDPLARLTPRQRRVLQLISEGQTLPQIAKTLSIRPSTADSHRTELMRRLDIHNLASLVRFAISQSVVGVE